jgi:hypothetical protein
MYIRYQVYWEGYRSYMNRTDPSSFIKQIKFLYDMHSNAEGLSIYVINDKAEEIYDGPLNKIVIDGLAVNLNHNNDNNN